MNILFDTHTHTTMTDHAYSTLYENVMEAKRKGLEGIACTDHGPAIKGCAPLYTLRAVMCHLPDYLEGIRVVRGFEANILDYEGHTDMEEEYFQYVEFCIASIHTILYDDGGVEQNTNAILTALRHPHIDVIGHAGNPRIPIDYEAYVKEARDQNKLVEINSNSFAVRPGSEENCKTIIRLCKQYDVRVTIASDAHIYCDVGDFTEALRVLDECEFPEELVVCSTLERFHAYLDERKKRIAAVDAT